MSRRKARIATEGPSALQQLKALPWEVQEGLFAQRDALSGGLLLALIEREYGIVGLSEQRLSDYWRWLAGCVAVRRLNEDAAQFREEMARASASQEPPTPEQIHRATVDYLSLKGMREDNAKLLVYAASEARRAIALEQSRERWLEAQRAKIDAGLAAVFEEIKHDAVAVELFEKIKDRIRPEGKE